MSGIRRVKRITGIEAPGHGGARNACFVRGFDVADFVTDVEHLGGFERKGFADGFEVFGFASELGGGGNKGEVRAQAVSVQKQIDVVGGVGGEDAKDVSFGAEAGQNFGDAWDEWNLGNTFAEHGGTASEKRGHAKGGNFEVGEQFAEGEVAQGVHLVGLDAAETVLRSELIVDVACLFEGISDGAVEVENDGAVVHGLSGWVCGVFGIEGFVEEFGREDFLNSAEAE